MTSQRQTSLFTEDRLTSSQVDSHANPIQQQESEKGKRIRDTYGLRCLEQFGKFNRHGYVGENVLGLVNWDGGLVFEEVQADLEAEGYEVQPYVLPAASVNAPHLRNRVFFVAYKWTAIDSNHKGRSSGSSEIQSKDGEVSEWDNYAKPSDSSIQWISSDSNSNGRQKNSEFGYSENKKNKEQFKCTHNSRNASHSDGFRLWGQSDRTRDSRFFDQKGKIGDWKNFPTVSPICSRNDGISDRLDSITFSKWRNESIKAGGNAIVPQVVHQIFKAIQQYNDLEK
jgi:DNA (cytosine-5)-methyltransferase 1